MKYLNINEINSNHNLYILLFHLANDEKIIKFGYSDNIKRRMGDYLSSNPTIYILYTGYREDAKQFESYFHTNTISKYKREYYEFDLLDYTIRCIEGKTSILEKSNLSGIDSEIKTYTTKKTFEEYNSEFINNHHSFEDSSDEFDNEEYKYIITKHYELFNKVISSMSDARDKVSARLQTSSNATIVNRIVRKFNVGTSYTRKDVKEVLQLIYDQNDIKRKAKHTDLNEFFEVREKKSNGERYCEILKRK